MKPLQPVANDGLRTPDVGEWGEEKYQLVRCYAEIFATGMKKKFEQRVYIDLYSGSGRARLNSSKRIVEASPLLVLGIKDPFNRYVFCDIEHENINDLKVRVERDHPGHDVRYIPGDSNSDASIDEVIRYIPQHSPTNRVLSFCFVDPFNVRNLKFRTIERLAAGKRMIDFLILIPSGMDATRNEDKENTLFAEFLGNPAWRHDRASQPNRAFGSFFVDEFAKSMDRIGYQWDGLTSARVITNETNSPIYHLAFFSRNPRGSDFWKKCQQSTTRQRTLFQ